MAQNFHCCFSCKGILEHCNILPLLILLSHHCNSRESQIIRPVLLFFQVVTDILHLQGQKLSAYKGDYDIFERIREEQMKNKQKAFESNERSRAHMQVIYASR